jgi:hypothetical protein
MVNIKPVQIGLRRTREEYLMIEDAKKDDQGKAPFALIPTYPLTALAYVYGYGACKYDAHNWRKGMKWGRIFSAIMRHLWAFWRGETMDAESGMPHLAHAAWGCFTLLEYSRSYDPDHDDRYIEDGFNECTD